MANPKIKFKRSAVEGKRPDINSMELGELAVNTYDGRIFVKRDTSGAAGIETGNKLVNPWIENNANTGIACTYQVNVSGISTFVSNVTFEDDVVFDKKVEVGSGTTITTSGIVAAGIVTAQTFVGDGSGLYNIASTAVEENFTATANQTAFTTTQDFTSETYVQVFINGVKIRKSDFTATATNTVTLDDGANTGDEVDIVLFV